MKLLKACFTGAALLVATASFSQTLKEAIRLTENEQYEKAAAAYKKLIQAEPSNGDIYFYYGDNYFRNDQADSAAMFFKKGTEVNASNPLNYVGLGKVQWQKNNQTEARSNFFKAITFAEKTKNVTALAKLAEAYITADNKNLDEAFKHLQTAAKWDPNNIEVLLLTGDAYLEKNDGSKAVIQFNKATELDKKSAKGHVRLGKLWVRAKNFKEALDAFAKAIEAEPNFAPAYRERAELYFKIGKYSEAVADYEKYLQLNPDLGARVRYASFLFLNKQYDKSVEQIQQVHTKDSTIVSLYRIMAYSKYETKDYPTGLSYMTRFFDKAGKQGTKILASDYEYLGKLQAETGQDSLGVLSMEKAISLDTTRTDLYGEMGELLMKKKKYKEAAAAIEKKVASGKDLNVNDYNRLGKAHYLTKDYVKADSAFAQVSRMAPSLPVGYLWRAKTNAQLDPDSKQGLAKPFYEQVVVKAQADPVKNKKELVEAYEYLGGYYLLISKDYACAKAAYNKLKEIDAANEKAKRALTEAKVSGAGDCELIKQQ